MTKTPELSQATYHDIRFQYDPRRAIVWRVLSRYLQRRGQPEEAVLELGAGYGEFTREIKASEK